MNLTCVASIYIISLSGSHTHSGPACDSYRTIIFFLAVMPTLQVIDEDENQDSFWTFMMNKQHFNHQ
jgi:hypothetical protein